jgi:hypothetical protein
MAPGLSHAFSFLVGLFAVLGYVAFLRDTPFPTGDGQASNSNLPRFITTMAEPETYTLPELPYKYNVS